MAASHCDLSQELQPELVISRSETTAGPKTKISARLLPEHYVRDTKSGDNSESWPYTSLCRTCSDAFHQLTIYLNKPEERSSSLGGDIAFTTDIQHFADVSALRNSAQLYCTLCKLFLEHIEKQPDEHPFQGPFNISFWVEKGDPAPRIDKNLTYISYKMRDPKLEVWYQISFTAELDSYDSRSRNIPSLPPLAVANDWIQDCKSCHVSCKTSDNKTLPTRLVKVGPEDDDVRLLVVDEDLSHDSNNLPALYIALSHCWGKPTTNARLTKANLRLYRHQIPVGSLGSTIRDAIRATRGMGYAYLWVDSLCIVQDDETDWQKECSRMEGVYSNSDITLAAVAAADGNAGFLKPRPLPSGSVCELLLYGPERRIGRLTVQFVADLTTARSKGQQCPETVLKSRAWTFQEALLSPRVLYFGMHQMHFECRADKRSEEALHPFEIPIWRETEKSPSAFFRIAQAGLPWWMTGLTCPEQTQEDCRYAVSFYELLLQYSTRQLTNGDDVLPALSGIARRYHNRTGHEYLAGLWREDLVRGLCWHSTDYTSSKRSKQHFKVPSWSWAAVRSSIEWGHHGWSVEQVKHFMKVNSAAELEYDLAAEIIDAWTVPVGRDPFGQVNGGELTIRGHVREVAITDEIDSCGRVVLGIATSPRNLRSLSQVELLPDRLLPTTYLEGQQVITSMLLCIIRLAADEVTLHSWYALALVPAETGRECFRRIGLVKGEAWDSLGWFSYGADQTIRIV